MSPQAACSLAAGEDLLTAGLKCKPALVSAGSSRDGGGKLSPREDFSFLVRSTALHLLSLLEQGLEGGLVKKS